MSTLTHLDNLGFHLNRIRQAWHLPLPAARQTPAVPATGAGWLDRLAAWADRHPPRQHRLGSYTTLT